MMEVREFRAEDAADVSRILFESFKTFLGDRMANEKPRPPEELAKSAGGTHSALGHGQSFVAVLDDKVVGYIAVSVDLVRRIGTLGVIGVDPATMAHGAGTALFQAAYKFWMSYDVNKIYTCTSSINTRAQRYYARMGFVEEGRRSRHFFGDVDELSLVIYPHRKEMAAPAVDVRAMTEADVDGVAALLEASDEVKNWSADRLRNFLKSKTSLTTPRAIVAVDKADGRPVGAMLTIYIEIYNLARTQFLYVDKTRRKQGIGTVLYQGGEADWKSGPNPVRKADCLIPLDKANGLPFMMHHGFVVEEALSEQAGPGIAEIHLGKFFA